MHAASKAPSDLHEIHEKVSNVDSKVAKKILLHESRQYSRDLTACIESREVITKN